MKYEIADHLNKSSRQNQGSFYTPKKLALKMAKMLKLKSKCKVLDPCCGKGNLFVAVLEIYDFISNEDLYGVDIDPEAIRFCIEKFPGGNFQVGNVLEDDITDDRFWQKDPFAKFDPTKRLKSGFPFGGEFISDKEIK